MLDIQFLEYLRIIQPYNVLTTFKKGKAERSANVQNFNRSLQILFYTLCYT